MKMVDYSMSNGILHDDNFIHAYVCGCFMAI